jgi:hypothetical protein
MLQDRATPGWPRALGAAVAISILGGLGALGCFTGGEGLSPPIDRFYYPTGLAISASGKALYVANSDFDLRYDGGTVLAIDLAAVRDEATRVRNALIAGAALDAACANGPNADTVLYPGPCKPLVTKSGAVPFIKDTAIIGAFASGAALATGPEGTRLFVPVRGDPSITYFDVTGDVAEGSDPIYCGAAKGARCTDDFRIGENPYETSRGIELPLEPVGIAAGPAGEAIVTAHQTQGAASLIVNTPGQMPVLEYVLPNLAPGPTELAAVPLPGVAEACGDQMEYDPGFLLTYRAAPQLDLLRYNDDDGAAPARGFLTRAASLDILANTSGFDSRGVAIDASERQLCETACNLQWQGCEPGCFDDRIACLAACTDIPMRFYVANRAPASLLIGVAQTRLIDADTSVPKDPATETSCGALRLTSAYETLEIQDTVPLAYGASRVAIGHVVGDDGHLHQRVFAVAFDSRFIFSYDPEARRIDAIIRTGRGPHAIAFDTEEETQDMDGNVIPAHSFLYVGHFTDSYIGVVDLDTRNPATFGSMILTLGQPEPPQESQ